MPDRRQFITGIATLSTVGIAGCADTEEEPEEPESEEEEVETESEEDVSVELPSDSSLLFEHAELNDQKFVNGSRKERDFPAGSFTEDQVGTNVTEFDLANADTSNVEDMRYMFLFATSFNQDIGSWDTSNVEDMGGMFYQARSFNQDISGWCVEDITDRPTDFDFLAGFQDADPKQPNWGEPC